MNASDRAEDVRDAPDVGGGPDAGAYQPHDTERWTAEPVKRSGRTPFARDRARVLHSAALRRLAAKTQVVGPGTDDFVRTRLTHTLEVAQVGRDLGSAIGCDPDLVEAACLAHDLGHPPFGHNGERALDEQAAAIGGFEGNAQTLRLLTRLEAKAVAEDGRSVGLNLTRASLDAATKYPWRRGAGPDPSKFGVYAEDLAVFEWLRTGAPAGSFRRCLEAQVMDFADDVAYSVHDVEDGVVAGKIDLASLVDHGRRKEVWEVVRDWYLPDADDTELDAAYDRLRETGSWPAGPYDGSRPALAVLKELTSQLIGRFCSTVEQATHAVYGGGRLTRYAADLVVPSDIELEIAVLKGIAALYVMRTTERERVLVGQRELLHELVGALLEIAPRGLQPAFAADFAAARDGARGGARDAAGGSEQAAQLRVVIDQVASLTDGSALALHQELVG